MLPIYMTGISHTTAPVPVRERFALTATEKNQLMAAIAADPDFDGCVLISTCNRTELWVSGCKLPEQGLHEVLCRFKGQDADAYAPYFLEKSGEDAVAYLFEMTSGLHSRIIGEDQILTQVKRALDDAREAGCCGSILEVLFRSAVTGAKKVKTELSLSTANASAAEIAIRELTAGGMDFRGRKCLVIGNGEMGKRAATALIGLGAQVTVTIRQYRSGIVEVVPGCQRVNYADRYDCVPGCDILVSATSSPNYTITRSELEKCPLREGLILLDLAVPRDIEPAVAELPGVELMDIDSFSVPRTGELESQLARADELLKEQQQKFLNWLGCRDLLPMLDSIGTDFGCDVLFRMGQTLKALPPEQRDAVQNAVLLATGKVLKKALFAVRDQAGADAFRYCVNAMDSAWK